MKKRIVVIVGRPNVGKSAIFNRLVGRRAAIVHPESGVTRDRLMREVFYGEHRFVLVDTGGISGMDRAAALDEIAAGIRRQVEAALSDAAAAMFVVDIRSGIVPLDHEVADMLRRSGCFTVIAANKADAPDRDQDALEFQRFEFPVFPVSALHNRGFNPLLDSIVGALPDVENVAAANPLKVAVVGRPNVGKSSYINRLLQCERVIVSESPGTTRDSVNIPFAVGKGNQARHYVLIDTAGLRPAGKITSAIEKFSHFRAQESIGKADIVVVMLDAAQGPTAQDKKIESLVLERHKGCVILVNKWDLADATQRKYFPEIFRAMPFMAYCPVVFVSAKSGYNVRRSVEVMDHVASQIRAVLPTGILNRIILAASARVPPPMMKGKALKIFYSTQVGTAPVRIRLFVNDPERMKKQYKDYLVGVLRKNFGLEGAPVILELQSRGK